MPKKPCLICGVLSYEGRCPAHRKRSPSYAATKRRAATVAAHRATVGDVCPGWQREPHVSADLTADHLLPLARGGAEDGPLQVLCRSCNSRRSKLE